MNSNYIKEAWHTCPLKETQSCEYITNLVPFKSKNEGQWLTQGYYFWLDIDHAKDWGIIRKFERYAISHIMLKFDDERDIFDLRETKNLKHLAQVAKTIEKAYTKRNQKPKNIRTVAHIISFLRKYPDEIFKGVAVLAADSGCVLKKEDSDFWKDSIPFTEKTDGSLSKEKLSITRNQLCVFEIGANPEKTLLEIKEYKDGK